MIATINPLQLSATIDGRRVAGPSPGIDPGVGRQRRGKRWRHVAQRAGWVRLRVGSTQQVRGRLIPVALWWGSLLARLRAPPPSGAVVAGGKRGPAQSSTNPTQLSAMQQVGGAGSCVPDWLGGARSLPPWVCAAVWVALGLAGFPPPDRRLEVTVSTNPRRTPGNCLRAVRRVFGIGRSGEGHRLAGAPPGSRAVRARAGGISPGAPDGSDGFDVRAPYP